MENSNQQTEIPQTPKKELSYTDIERIVEYLVSTKSNSFSFDVYGPEDIGQEIRIICLRALQHFDTEKVQPDRWANFFGRCVDNALKNLKRDNYIRPSTPCKDDCSALHGEEYLTSDIDGVCKRWLKHRQNIQRRIGIMHPVNIEAIGDVIKDSKMDQDIQFRDLTNYILEKLPDELHEPFEEMLNGRGSKLTLNQRRKVQKAVKALLKNNSRSVGNP